MADEKLLLIGCGIFKAEIEFLCAKNHWSLDTHFLPPSLHIDFKALQSELTCALDCHAQRDTVVFYGACHPLMEQMLHNYHTLRSEGQNCVEMLLGRERFMAELEQGAFFLLEDWVRHWDKVILKTFGNHPAVIKQIFQQDHRYLLCLNTPCSHDFTDKAQAIGATLGLPVQSLTVSLDFLEMTLQNLFKQKQLSCVL
jgi:hypothetical protein